MLLDVRGEQADGWVPWFSRPLPSRRTARCSSCSRRQKVAGNHETGGQFGSFLAASQEEARWKRRLAAQVVGLFHTVCTSGSEMTSAPADTSAGTATRVGSTGCACNTAEGDHRALVPDVSWAPVELKVSYGAGGDVDVRPLRYVEERALQGDGDLLAIPLSGTRKRRALHGGELAQHAVSLAGPGRSARVPRADRSDLCAWTCP